MTISANNLLVIWLKQRTQERQKNKNKIKKKKLGQKMASYLYEQLLGNLLYLIFLKFCQCFSISYIEVGVHLVLIQISFH